MKPFVIRFSIAIAVAIVLAAIFIATFYYFNPKFPIVEVWKKRNVFGYDDFLEMALLPFGFALPAMIWWALPQYRARSYGQLVYWIIALVVSVAAVTYGLVGHGSSKAKSEIYLEDMIQKGVIVHQLDEATRAKRFQPRTVDEFREETSQMRTIFYYFALVAPVFLVALWLLSIGPLRRLGIGDNGQPAG